MEKVQAFKTSDGKLFDLADEAERHEEFISNSDIIEKFLDSDLNPYGGPQRVVARNTIINWGLWKIKNGIE